jgi:hypothetical protein
LFIRIVEHVDLLCWQEALVSWADLDDVFGLPFPSPAIGFHVIADRAVDYAMCSPPLKRLQGIYCVLSHIISIEGTEKSVSFCSDLQTVRGISDSLKVVVFNEADRLKAGEPPELQLVICAGVGLVEQIAKVLQKASSPDDAVFAARQFLRQSGKATYSHLDKKYPASPALEQLRIDIFPAYWRGGIDMMADLFFRREGASAEFNRTMLKALRRWHGSKDPVHFEVFIHSHKILAAIRTQRFPLQDSVRNSPEPQLLMNAHVFALARLIYEGKYKEQATTEPDEPTGSGPRPVPRAYLKEYDEFGAWIQTDLWKQIDYVRRKWMAIEGVLR